MVEELQRIWEQHIVALGYHDYDRALRLIDDLQAFAPDGYFDEIIKDIDAKQVKAEANREIFWKETLIKLQQG
jgi:hypothetical protein